MKKKKKKKAKKVYKSDMPEITEFKEMFDSCRLKFDRTTPYEMGTRDYATNTVDHLKTINENKGWVNYKKKRTAEGKVSLLSKIGEWTRRRNGGGDRTGGICSDDPCSRKNSNS